MSLAGWIVTALALFSALAVACAVTQLTDMLTGIHDTLRLILKRLEERLPER